MDSRKRKRETGNHDVRVTYHALHKIFERVFKEESLEETKDVVRHKLGLADDAVVHLSQLREGQSIDLEDDGDFEAFQVFAQSVPSVDVEVTIVNMGSTVGELRSRPGTPHSKRTRFESPEEEYAPTTPVPSAIKKKRRLSVDASKSPRRASDADDVSQADKNDMTAPSSVEPPIPPEEPKRVIRSRKSKTSLVPETTVASSSKLPATSTIDDGPESSETAPKPPEKVKKLKLKKATDQVDAENADMPPMSFIFEFLQSMRDRSTVPDPLLRQPDNSPEENTSLIPDVIHDAGSISSPANISPLKSSRKDSKAPKPLPAEKEALVAETSAPPVKKRIQRRKNVSVAKASTETHESLTTGNSEGVGPQAALPTVTQEVPKVRKRIVKTVKPKASSSSLAKKVHESTENGTMDTQTAGQVRQSASKVAKKANKPVGHVNDSMEVGENDLAPNETTDESRKDVDGEQVDKTVKSSKRKSPGDTNGTEPGGSNNLVVELESSNQRASSVASSVTSKKAAVKSRGSRTSSKVPCPVCLCVPFHLRYRCPILVAGPEAIQKRVDELKEEDLEGRRALIDELEVLLAKRLAKYPSKNVDPKPQNPPPTVKDAKPIPPIEPSPAPSPPTGVKQLPASNKPIKPIIPKGSRISEVTVQSRDEGSSNESSDDEDVAGESVRYIKDIEPPLPSSAPSSSGLVVRPDATQSFEDDLAAIIRGPGSSKSILSDALLADDEGGGDEDEDDQDKAVLEEDDDDDFRRLSKKARKTTWSSDEGSDAGVAAEDAGSPDASITDPKEPGSGAVDNIDISFSAVNNLGESIELDRRGDNAVRDALKADDALIIEALQEPELPSSVDQPEVENPSLGPNEVDTTQTTAIVDPSADVSMHEVPALQEVFPEVEPGSGHSAHSPDPDDSPDKPSNQPSSPILAASQPRGNGAQTSGHIHDTDPIQPADDLLVPTQLVDDPIEVESVGERSVASPPSSLKPGMVKRMKNRSGKTIETDEELPVPAADTSTTLNGKKGKGATNSSQPKTSSASRSRKLMPPPDSAPAPKRRRLTEEEKFAREAAKFAKAQEKEATKLAKAREKEATKLAKEEEKRRKQEEKARAQEAKKGGKKPLAKPHPTLSTPKTSSATSVHSPPPSVTHWETLSTQPSSPQVIGEESMMVDQLQTSSPTVPSSNTVVPTGQSKPSNNDPSPVFPAETPIRKDPLFNPSSSQVPFPYSQWGSSMVKPNGQENGREGSDDSESETERLVYPPPKLRGRSPQSTLRYRRLTDITSQDLFSSQPMSTPTAMPSRSSTQDQKLKELYGRSNDEDEDDEDDSASDSDGEQPSHIPASRRVGGVKSSKRG